MDKKIICVRCGLNPNDTQSAEQQKDEVYLILENKGICSACVQEISETITGV